MDSESASDGEKGKNEHKDLNYKEILNETKQDARLIKSRLQKRDSEDANDAIDKLHGLITGLTAQLAFAKCKLTVYEKLQGSATVEKAENSYAIVAQRITGIKEDIKKHQQENIRGDHKAEGKRNI